MSLLENFRTSPCYSMKTTSSQPAILLWPLEGMGLLFSSTNITLPQVWPYHSFVHLSVLGMVTMPLADRIPRALPLPQK